MPRLKSASEFAWLAGIMAPVKTTTWSDLWRSVARAAEATMVSVP